MEPWDYYNFQIFEQTDLFSLLNEYGSADSWLCQEKEAPVSQILGQVQIPSVIPVSPSK